MPNFEIVRPDGGRYGFYLRSIRVDYDTLDMSSDPGRVLDRRIAVGFALLIGIYLRYGRVAHNASDFGL